MERETSTQAPNYFLTKDFKTFKSLSHIQPQKSYNWLTSELINYSWPDGTKSKAILFKPEDFDSARKYPVIFNYYEKKSYGVYNFPKPDFSISDINIPYYVSRGYIVCQPDIDYIVGEPGKSALKSVVAAAEYLAKFKWVDSSKMGLQGHSFGGFETNYIITHSNLFAAACSASGVSDIVSSYGEIRKDIGQSNHFHYEENQGRMGATLWQNPLGYIKNSPVFSADQVTTPLLILDDKADGAVDFNQGIELFTALSRLNKKVWLLQYDNGNHSVEGKDAEDFTIRMQQFFDYYLKGAPPPKWMTVGVPARLKGIDSGLELDTSGRQP